MTRRFGNSDKVTEALEVLTLIRGELQGIGAGGGGAPFSAQYVTLATHSTLTNERILTAGDGIDLTDAGANSTVTLAVDVTDILGSGLTETSNNIDLDWGTPTIGTIESDDAASAGTSTNPARSDHQHAIVNAAPGADSVNLAASAEGSAASFARSDHTHNLDESITPTWTGAHTFDDGSGDSPAINLVGGSNDDTATIFLLNDVDGAGRSDLVIQLCDTGGESKLLIRDSTPANVLQIDSNGNIGLLADGNYIGRGPSSGRISFNATGNAVQLYSGADLELYNDAGVTRVGLWDGGTGNISLDDGYGNSPNLNFVGGTNDDTATIYLADSGTSGQSDLVIQLCDAAGNSKLLVTDSSLTLRLGIDSDGNIEMVDGATIGQAAGPLLTFDDTNNYLEISQCSVGIGTATPGRALDVIASASSAVHTARFLSSDQIGVAIGGIAISGSDYPGIQATNASAGTYPDMLLQYTGGNVSLGPNLAASARLHIDQNSTSASIPVLYLDQADVSEEMIQFNTTIGVGNAVEAVGGKSLTTTHFIKVAVPGGSTRYLPVGTIA